MANQTFGSVVFKRGGSLAISIKPALAKALGLAVGDPVVMAIYGRHLIIRRISRDDVLRADTIPVDALPGPVANTKPNTE